MLRILVHRRCRGLRRFSLLALLTLALSTFELSLVGCSHLPADSAPQARSGEPAALLPPLATLQPRYPSWGLWRQRIDVGRGWTQEKFGFEFYDDVWGRFGECSGELWQPRERSDLPLPLIVVSPILGGALTDYFECRFFCKRAARAGYASFFLYQDQLLIDPLHGASTLERALRSDVRRNIQGLSLLLEQGDWDPQRLGCFGISLGGIRATLLAAAEPRLRASVICLGGSQLPSILDASREGMVQDYFSERQRLTGCERSWILGDLSHNLATDPSQAAGRVDPQSLFLLLARFDRHVPVARGYELRRQLREPETWIVPFGHYSALLVFPWAVGVANDFFSQRFEIALPGGATAR